MRKGSTISAETRRKMSAAKMDAANPKARACETTFNGETLRFHSTAAAGRHHGVSQQAMEAWLSGRSAWPKATGRTKRQNRRLAGLAGRYLPDATTPSTSSFSATPPGFQWPEGM